MSDLQITTRIPADLARQARLQAGKEQRTVAGLLRIALVQYLERERQAAKAVKRG